MKMRLQTRLMVTVIVGVVAVVAVVGSAAYRIARNSLLEEAFAHLESVAQSRVAHVSTFIEAHTEIISMAARSAQLADGLRALEAGAPDRASVVQGLNARLAAKLGVEVDLYELCLLDGDGVVVASATPEHIGLDRSTDGCFLGARTAPFIKDAHRSAITGRDSIAISAPLLRGPGGDLLGVLVAHMDTAELDTITTDRTGLGETGETYLINEDGLMITPSRFQEDTFLNLRVDTDNARAALADIRAMRQGQLPEEHEHEALVAIDYRGVRALGVHDHIAEMGWSLLAEVDVKEAFAPVIRLRRAVVLVGLLLAGGGLVLASLLARHISGPIHELHEGSERIGAGELDYRLSIRTGDEIEQLADEFNRMAAKLSATYSSLEQKVAERTEELRLANAELERSNRDLQDFTYTVSHDLQDPLRKIHTFGQFLMEDCAEHIPPEGREHLQRMQGAALRMKELIQHLLTLARVGTRGGELVPVEVRQVIDSVLDTLGEQVRECQAEVVVEDELPTVMADAVQLERVFQNLIGNALKFRSPERAPEVTVSAEVDGDYATLSVRDNGIGIEERFLERIFGVFQRLHPREQYEGAGVGLALCEKVIRRHGGRIWAESELGKGTAFCFTLPIASERKEEDLESC